MDDVDREVDFEKLKMSNYAIIMLLLKYDIGNNMPVIL